jgi:dihydroorotate dehydrogenase electron transfer subunit
VSVPQTVPIRAIRNDSRSIRTFTLDAQVNDARPGQFVMLWLPELDEKPMSIAYPAPLTVTVDSVGPFTTALHTRRVGTTVGWRGPYGRGFSLHEDRHALLLAGGCGVGPVYFLATQAAARGVSVTVALGARTSLDLPYLEQFRQLDVEFLVATDDGSEGYAGYVTSLAVDWLDRTRIEPAVYGCGPEAMLVATHRLCRERGLPGQVSVERYMKCGFGICGQCALDSLLVCQDGPVFEVEELDAVRDFGHAHRTATGRRLPIR